MAEIEGHNAPATPAIDETDVGGSEENNRRRRQRKAKEQKSYLHKQGGYTLPKRNTLLYMTYRQYIHIHTH